MDVDKCLDGIPPVIDNPHKEDYIEKSLEEMHVLNTEKVKMHVWFGGKSLKEKVVKVVLDHGIDTQDELGVLLQHTVHVVGVVTSHIADPFVFQIGQHRLDPVPLEIASPLRVDMGFKDLEGPFTPGDKLLQTLIDQLELLVGQFIAGADFYGVTAVIAKPALELGKLNQRFIKRLHCGAGQIGGDILPGSLNFIVTGKLVFPLFVKVVAEIYFGIIDHQ